MGGVWWQVAEFGWQVGQVIVFVLVKVQTLVIAPVRWFGASCRKRLSIVSYQTRPERSPGKGTEKEQEKVLSFLPESTETDFRFWILDL
jgi:hypothetical protein